jgi:hypothetical protein
MAGKFSVSAGLLSMRAGVYISPSLDLTDDDFSDVDTVQIVATAPRENTFNAVTGTFSAPANQYLQADFPKVSPSAYLSADGGIELATDIELGGVNHLGQAQHVCAVMLRDSRQALTVTASFKLSAYQLEVFDACTLTSSVFGWSAKKFEVVNREWSMHGGVRLTLKETAPSIYTMDSTFTAYDPAPNSNLPAFWDQVGTGALTITSDDSTLIHSADGSYAASFTVSWSPVSDKSVSSPSGKIEVAYIPDGSDTGGVWPSKIVDGNSTRAIITGVFPGYTYKIRTRTFNGVAWSKWMAFGQIVVVGKSVAPPNVSGLTATQTTGGVLVSWTPNPDADRAYTQIRLGSTWSTGAVVRDISEPLDQFTWAWPSAGTYTLTAKHFDATGNESATAASVSITVSDSGIAIVTEQIKDYAATDIIYAHLGSASLSIASGSSSAATVYCSLTYENTTNNPIEVEVSSSCSSEATFASGVTNGVGNSYLDAYVDRITGPSTNLFPSPRYPQVSGAVGALVSRWQNSEVASATLLPGDILYCELSVYIIQLGTTAAGCKIDTRGAYVRIAGVKK